MLKIVYSFADAIGLLIPAYISDSIKFDRYSYTQADISFGSSSDEEIRAYLLYLLAGAMTIVGNLLFDLVVVFLLGCWIQSMKSSASTPSRQKLLIWAHRSVVSSYITYPVLSSAALVGIFLIEFYTPNGRWILIGAKIAYAVNWLSQIVAVAWMYFDFFMTDKEYCPDKRRVFFNANSIAIDYSDSADDAYKHLL